MKVLTDASSAIDPAIKVEFVPDEKFADVAYTLAPEKEHRFSIYDMSDGSRARSARLSPDGKYLITSFVEVFGLNKQRTWAELTDTRTGKVINANLQGDADWMPKGSTLYYTVKRDDFYDLVNVSLPAMTSTTVATGLPTASFMWSPDASYFIYYKEIEGTRKEGIMQRYTSPDDRMPDTRVPELQLASEAAMEKLAELDERFPDIIRACGKESALTERRLWAEREASAEKHMREWGVEVTTLSAAEKARFRAAVEPMYAAFEEQSRLIQRIREA